ncbi:hypothetical protein EW145_g4393 [Phellinidium pouzarii]|uniref:Amine oxidase n=1 Tax=Phellinidium pouzarii TaxID=167371 RepID=A0A4S4L541_9AGAM|nr:hypothetical protein EW145_g4393 [Phellinidium pouzarii]
MAGDNLTAAQDSTKFAPSTATEVQKLPAHAFLPNPSHPLDPLSPDELSAVSLAIRAFVVEKTSVKALKFITSNTGEPAAAPPAITRKAESDFIDLVTGDAYNIALLLKDGKWVVDHIEKLPDGTQPQISVEELAKAEEIVKSDARVIALAKEVGVLAEHIACDGWAIGYDVRFPNNKRIQQALLFARYSQHENLYAHPLDFVPIVDSNSSEVIHIDFPPSRDANGKLSTEDTLPRPLEGESSASAKRERIPPPSASCDFLPDLISNYKARDDVKPLHIVQPEGVSFKMNGNELEWQKWKMHIAFHHREGIAISTITYNDNGTVRPVFYRLSLAEMVVPYAAPEFPHPRKFAFDSGEYGMGTMANDLSLGCDCVGAIHYLPGCFVGNDGSAIKISNAICIHEEDDGLLWKHSDYRPGGRSFEYIWNYRFYQDGSIEFEVRLTGVLQVYVKADNEATPYGTEIAKNINAHYHQHLFSLRVDPMIDGLNNSVEEVDVVPVSSPTGSSDNFAGNAFRTESKTLKTSAEGVRDYSFDRDRRWRIVNPNSAKHYSSGAAPGYSIMMKGAVQTLLAKEKSWVAKRAVFGTKALWVVKDKEGPDGSRIWPSGKYVPQTRDEPAESIGPWAKENVSIDNEDILLYLTLGINHIPRPEDWPVMPVEHLNVLFKPQNFFRASPALDVPKADDSKSCSAFSQTINTNQCHI